MTRTVEMTAEFSLVRHAARFVELYLVDGKSSSANVARKSKVVTWTATTDNDLYEWDLTENAGVVGSSTKYRATVNGRRAPISY